MADSTTSDRDYKDELLEQVTQAEIEVPDITRERRIGDLATAAHRIIEGARASKQLDDDGKVSLDKDQDSRYQELVNEAERLKYAVPHAKERYFAKRTQEALADAADVPQKLQAGWGVDQELDKVEAWQGTTEEQWLIAQETRANELMDGARSGTSVRGFDQREFFQMQRYGQMIQDDMRAAVSKAQYVVDPITTACLAVTERSERFVDGGMRTLGTGAAPGSVLLPPPVHDAGITAFLAQDNWLRRMATIRRLPRNRELKVRIETGETAFAWGGDTSMDSARDPSFELLTLGANSATRRIDFTHEVLRVTPFDLLTELRMIVGRDGAHTLENAYFMGTGASNQPYGLLTESASGTAKVGIMLVGNRNVVANWATFLAATNPTLGTFIDAPYSIRTQYSRNGVWFMHRKTWKDLIDLRTDGQPIVDMRAASLPAGAVGSIAMKAVYLSEEVPSIAATTNIAVFLDPKQYYIVDEVPLVDFSVLRELSASTRTIVVLAVYVGDGKPGFREAIQTVRVTAIA